MAAVAGRRSPCVSADSSSGSSSRIHAARACARGSSVSASAASMRSERDPVRADAIGGAGCAEQAVGALRGRPGQLRRPPECAQRQGGVARGETRLAELLQFGREFGVGAGRQVGPPPDGARGIRDGVDQCAQQRRALEGIGGTRDGGADERMPEAEAAALHRFDQAGRRGRSQPVAGRLTVERPCRPRWSRPRSTRSRVPRRARRGGPPVRARHSARRTRVRVDA